MKTILKISLALLFTGPGFAQVDLGPLNLPTEFTPLPFYEGFEAAAGQVPNYMALTELDAGSLTHDNDAWCNIGNRAACLNPPVGSFALEMGLNPNYTSNIHYVRNAMVLGLDGSQYNGSFRMGFMAYDGGEETHTVDGVWLSNDGVDWYQAYGPWTSLSAVWTELEGVDLAAAGVNLRSQFYLAFVQEDNYPYFDIDGVGIDEITIPVRPSIESTPLTAGGYGVLTLDTDIPYSTAYFIVSKVGLGQIQLGNVLFDLAGPIHRIAARPTDSQGNTMLVYLVPADLSGNTLYIQAAIGDWQYSLTTKVLAEPVQ
ncbi:MAG: hypothetical protein DWQ01_21510 [Planctomycetota bacterium]|nr:MAG: hypothetical protein DWQ01_21510 [Planctomycetota bacterium]